MVTLFDRRDYYDSQHGALTILKQVGEVVTVPEFNREDIPQVKIEVLEAITEAEVEAWLFTVRVKSMTDAVQVHLDNTAQSWGYDNIISLCTYDGNSDPKYSAEGAAGKEWRSSVWRHCENELEKIAATTRQEPESVEAFILELPKITRPTV